MTLTDITELKQAEADRIILNKLESTGILAGGIAHDFNNLLAGILLNLEMVLMLGPPTKEQESYLEEAKQSGLLARNLTAQLITFAEGGTPSRGPMFLAELIRESVQRVSGSFKVQCDFFLAEDLWAAEVDAGQIRQVIRNLVLNACEAMPKKGKIVIRAENVLLNPSELPSLPAGEYVRVSIVDQGAGIAKDVLPKIFDPYFSTKQRGPQKGMGLGLAICHSVVQKHKGAITVESCLGVGTTFQVYLPAKRTFSGTHKMSAPAKSLRTGRLLVMDDEAGVRGAVGLMLSEMGHAVELAKDGKMAIEMYDTAMRLSHRFDVVILDLTVRDGVGGQQAIQALLKIDPGVKAIVMSGNILDPVILHPKSHGFKGALTKPFNEQKLRELLSEVLENSADGHTAP
jgi:CheY-like chemotaxis protein